MSDGAESAFEYEYPSGYDSNDPDNPEFIQVLSSGNNSPASDANSDQKSMHDLRKQTLN